MDSEIQISSAPVTNYTKPGFKVIREGFDPSNPKVGTETHEFTFATEPWTIVSTAGVTLAVLSNIILSVSKVFNPQNTTDSYAVLVWTPQNFYKPMVNIDKPIEATFKDANFAVLGSFPLRSLEHVCGVTESKSRRFDVDPKIFDRIQFGAFTLPNLSWSQC